CGCDRATKRFQFAISTSALSRPPSEPAIITPLEGTFMRWRSLLALCAMFASLVWGDVTGTIAGTITDPSGAVMPNTEVTVTNTGTNASFRAVSNDVGAFVITTLPLGVYNLTASSRG